MPELPEVETVRRGLAPVMEGALISRVDCRRPDLRFPFPTDFAGQLTGRRVVSLGRRAKYLLADLDNETVLIMHLGMSGSFRISSTLGHGDHEATPGMFYVERAKDAAHDHVVFDLENGARITYNDPRRFGFMTLVARSAIEDYPLLKNIGIEPLGNALDGSAIARLFREKKTPLKAALLDQKLIAGLGNIYVCEALWRSRLGPRRVAASLALKDGGATMQAERLSDAIRDVLAEAIDAGGSSLRDHVRTNGELGYFQHVFAVYDREGEPCPRMECSGVIERIVQSNRSTFLCPICQR